MNKFDHSNKWSHHEYGSPAEISKKIQYRHYDDQTNRVGEGAKQSPAKFGFFHRSLREMAFQRTGKIASSENVNKPNPHMGSF